MSDEKGPILAEIECSDFVPSITIAQTRYDRLRAREAALIKFVRMQRALEAAWNEIDELVGRDG
jgi:hypothetical protein